MSFVKHFKHLEAGQPLSPQLAAFKHALDDDSPEATEALARRSAATTRKHFGRTMRLFAPLYLSNECVNNCQYCGFSRDNPILRVTLSIEQLITEARHLSDQGFRHILLVAGEHPKFVSNGYLEECIEAIRSFVPQVAIEVGPMETPEYQRMVRSGAEGLVVYQETYHRETYTKLHTSGPKRNFDWRLECPERGYAGGFRRIGIGALFGLTEWKTDAVRLAAHLDYLLRNCWKASFTVSMPRMRPAAGEFQPEFFLPDADFVRLLCAFRVHFPEVGIVLSTREPASLRDAVAPLGITTMSAGSHTEPGGYTGQGTENLHLTVRGRKVEPDQSASPCSRSAEQQFDIADDRSPAQVAASLSSHGFDPVWKDWDRAILTHAL